MKEPRRIFIERNHALTETTPQELADTYDFSYVKQFMERWAFDAVMSWQKPGYDTEDLFYEEYLKIAHHDLVVQWRRR